MRLSTIPPLNHYFPHGDRGTSRATRCVLPNLNLNPKSRGQFFDGRSFLLAHLGAAEAKEASFFGGLGDLLPHSDQPLLEPLGLVGFGLLLDERSHLPHALDRITLDLIRGFAFYLRRRT